MGYTQATDLTGLATVLNSSSVFGKHSNHWSPMGTLGKRQWHTDSLCWQNTVL